jgi:hypothetical protein
MVTEAHLDATQPTQWIEMESSGLLPSERYESPVLAQAFGEAQRVSA